MGIPYGNGDTIRQWGSFTVQTSHAAQGIMYFVTVLFKTITLKLVQCECSTLATRHNAHYCSQMLGDWWEICLLDFPFFFCSFLSFLLCSRTCRRPRQCTRSWSLRGEWLRAYYWGLNVSVCTCKRAVRMVSCTNTGKGPNERTCLVMDQTCLLLHLVLLPRCETSALLPWVQTNAITYHICKLQNYVTTLSTRSK